MRLHLAALFAAVAAPLAAQTCPPAPDHAAELDALIVQAQAAETEAEGRALGNRMWDYWIDAPDQTAQDMLERGLTAHAAYDFATALAAFDALVAYCPDYAEGYNQRAFVNFIRGEHALALEDLDRALDRSPRHVAAMAGKALTLMNLGRVKVGQAVLREALALNPWLPERGYLIDGDPTAR